jgi:hypothetical protein
MSVTVRRPGQVTLRMLKPSAGSGLVLRNSKGLALHRQLPKAKTPQEHEYLKRTIAATDESIDALVSELCGLTDEEARPLKEKQDDTRDNTGSDMNPMETAGTEFGSRSVADRPERRRRTRP